MNGIAIAVTLVGIAALAGGAVLYAHARRLSVAARASDDEVRHRMYELAILKEVGDRIGYSLNVEKIANVIVGSLNQFIEYSAASFMLITPDKIIFKADLDRPISHAFLDDIKVRMRLALNALLDRDLSKTPLEETITGAAMVDGMKEPVRSFFNIPLVISGNIAGLLTIAHTKEGLYKEKEMTMLYKIVGQASQAVTKLEEVVTLERGKLQAMVESMADGVLMTDADSRVLVANHALHDIVSTPKGRDVTIFDVIDACGGAFDVRGRLEESIKQGRTFVVDNINLGGSIYQIFLFPVKGASAGGGTVGGGAIFHDITRERAAEKMREDFTSMMVHELRSPLDSIKKIGELLRTPSIRDDKAAYDEYMGMVYQSASNMLDLVNDLLDVAKLESGKFEVKKKPASIRELIEERVKFFETPAHEATLRLSFSFDEHIPHAIPFDPVRTAQVLSNLLSNAIKFTPPGGQIITRAFLHAHGANIDEEAAAAGIVLPFFERDGRFVNLQNSVVVAVTDNGEGISAENQERMFNKFEQFSTSIRSGEKKGTGLGLVIVKGITETQGGIAGVISQEGVGSTFYFTITV